MSIECSDPLDRPRGFIYEREGKRKSRQRERVRIENRRWRGGGCDVRWVAARERNLSAPPKNEGRGGRYSDATRGKNVQ